MKEANQFLHQCGARGGHRQQQTGEERQQQDPGGGHQRFKGMFHYGVNRQLKRH